MKKLNRVGEKYTTNEGYEVEIIEYNSKRDFTIIFENRYKIKMNGFTTLLKGKVKNPYHKSVFGVGYFGIGIYRGSLNKTQTKYYKDWLNMMQRGCDNKYKEKYPTYKDVIVCEEWHNFQNFAKWHEQNYVAGWHLDKDILVKGNKIYSPDKCCFIPQEINNIFTDKINKISVGVRKNKYSFTVRLRINGKQVHIGSYLTEEEAILNYCMAKERYIKEVAEKYKDKLSLEVYESLINFKINNYGNE